MKAEKLYIALGNVSNNFIEEAAYPNSPAVSHTQIRKTRKPFHLARFAPIAACAVIVLALAIALSDLQRYNINDPKPVDPGNTVMDNPGKPGSTTPPVAAPLLIMNTAAAVSSAAAAYPADHFTLELSEEQMKAVFPGLDLTLGASAHYRGDASVMSVTALETYEPGRTDLPFLLHDMYYHTVITLGQGKIAEDCVIVYETEPKVTTVYGVEVTAIRVDGNANDGVAFYQAEFITGGIAYRVELHDSDSGETGALRLAAIVYAIVGGTPADLSVLENPDIPELRFDELTLDEAQKDTRFGVFVLSDIPDGFTFESSYRTVTPGENSLSVHWGKPDCYLEISITETVERDSERVVHPNEGEKYDMSLYPIPLSESVPRELWATVTNPIFLSGELTLDVVKARAYKSGERNEGDLWKIAFNVLYDDTDTLVKITVKGISPEQLWRMIQTIAQ
ncbi:MAG: hypothetical protein LBL54_01605 [Clostridiales Family XIII bacterium]|jgi:hypothetical protein|nr:hypothetical protein [Clostridiales Family XIII bacterium]